MIVVDTSVWINQLNAIETPATLKLGSIQNSRQILVGDIVLLELLQGARSEAAAAHLEILLRRFVIKTMLNQRLAVKAAGNYRLLHRRGITIRTSIDMVIATFCIEHGHQLLQDDRDFVPMAEHLGLRLA